MDTKKHLLIVDDDAEIRTLLGDFLSQYGLKVSLARDGKEMFQQLAKHSFDLLILDVMLPGEDGLTLCKTVRADSNIPIIMLTAIGAETDRIIGLEIGADDYISKPFNPRELLARIKAVMRRSEGDVSNTAARAKPSAKIAQFAGWKLNLATHSLTSADNMEISLSAGEYDLLVAFIEHPQHVLSRDQLLDITKNREASPFDRSIDIQISRLRHKIEPDPKRPTLIKTIRGGGYLFTPDVNKQ